MLPGCGRMAELQGRRVLVVDDEAMVRFAVADELRCIGCHVDEAGDGQEAVEALSTSAFDLMVTDIRMPGIDGWALAERARELQPSLSVLYVTGFSHIEARRVSGSEVLAKPFLPKQRLASAARLLNAEDA